jgi:2-polyprenyl-3-methyl-5-hydroxy-6-metoxy-1,4-benzoquinol methylase
MPTNCPLCGTSRLSHYFEDKRRHYYQCSNCDFLFVPTEFHLSEFDEQAEYDQHENNPEDERYQQFLSRLMCPLLTYLSPHSKGLDFGSGPGPTLSLMLAEYGHDVSIYDKFYAPNKEYLNERYDFITMSEVIEHLSDPLPVLQQLWELLYPNGQFAIMTTLLCDKVNFKGWHYKNDPTHIGFYSPKTFHYIAKILNAKIDTFEHGVIILTKQEDSVKR